MKEIVGQVIADISEDAATINSGCYVPAVVEDGVGEFPKRRSQSYKQCRRHDEPVFIHRKIVVNTMKEKMQRDTHTIVRQITVQVSAFCSKL